MRLLGCFLICSALCGALPRPVGAATLQGRLLYEKIPATANGLDLARPVEVPAARVSVELAASDGTTAALIDTDENGAYRAELPDDPGPLKLTAWARSENLQVVDPNSREPHGVVFSAGDPAQWPEKHVIPDYARLSGPFNILATLRKANRRLEQSEPGLKLSDRPLVVYWSPGRNYGASATESALFLNGNRDTDSDEFDDSVILALYAECLLYRFSPVSGPRGPVTLGERVDPRQAWVEGWKLFFAQAVLGTPVRIDTLGADRSQASMLDLDQDQFEGNAPGYWSAIDVATALWDICAAAGGDGPHLGLGLGPIWRAMREYFPQQVFPYLITLADGLIQEEPSREAGITEILARREIRYQFGQEPPVPAPFPRPIVSGVAVTGQVDSLTSRKTNLIGATDYYLVQKESEAPLRVQLTMTGESSPGDGRLELVLMSAAGDPIKRTRLALWGAGDRSEMTVPLPPGRYVIAVRSYMLENGFTSHTVFSNARYELTAEF
jgi:hypothetical protein